MKFKKMPKKMIMNSQIFLKMKKSRKIQKHKKSNIFICPYNRNMDILFNIFHNNNSNLDIKYYNNNCIINIQ